MEIKGKVHCLFEQSGTFKNEFKKLGYEAYDYDIQNNFGETDFVVDLFSEIDKEYNRQTDRQTDSVNTIFDSMSSDDLIIAFFPCIYFETIQQLYFCFESLNNKHKKNYERVEDAIDRLDKRTSFHKLLYKLIAITMKKKIPFVLENPATKPSYLIDTQNLPKPKIIDNNRMLRGDYFRKPTAYWFFNCEPTQGFSYQNDKGKKTIMSSKCSGQAGLCSEERSMISPDYARNWICDFILGKVQENWEQGSLF